MHGEVKKGARHRSHYNSWTSKLVFRALVLYVRFSEGPIVASRREGNPIRYRLIDLCVRSLLDQGLCLMEGVSSPPSKDPRSCCS